MKVGRGRVPHGGWNYPVAPGVKLEAVSRDILHQRIFEYRLRNNIEIGDIERDVDDYYCRNWPDSCDKEPHEYQKNPGAERVYAEALINRVSRWASMILKTMPRGGVEMVTAQEATSRGNVCANCPKNTPWRIGCVGCSASTVAVLSQIKKLGRTPQDAKLLACSVAGWETSTAIWMPASFLKLTDDQLKALPANCWRRELT